MNARPVAYRQPDFYGYLVEVDAIQSEIASVVTALRRGLAGA
jgi:hypothetical protein